MEKLVDLSGSPAIVVVGSGSAVRADRQAYRADGASLTAQAVAPGSGPRSARGRAPRLQLTSVNDSHGITPLSNLQEDYTKTADLHKPEDSTALEDEGVKLRHRMMFESYGDGHQLCLGQGGVIDKVVVEGLPEVGRVIQTSRQTMFQIGGRCFSPFHRTCHSSCVSRTISPPM